MQRRTALKTLGATGVALATLDSKALATLGDKQEPLPFRKKLGWFGEVQSNKDFSVSPTIHHGTAANNPEIKIITPGFNIKWANKESTTGRTEFISTKSLTDFRRGKTKELIIHDQRHYESEGLVFRYHLFPEPYNVFRIPICGKQLLIQTWEKDCKVTIPNNGVARINSRRCNMTLFPPFFEKEMHDRRCTPQGNILLTADVFPDTMKWLWFTASTDGYYLSPLRKSF